VLGVEFGVMPFPFETWRKNSKYGHGATMEICRKAGVKAIEPIANWFFDENYQPNERYIEQFLGAAFSLGMRVPVVVILCDLVNPNKRNITKFESGIAVAHLLGAKIALVAGHGMDRGSKDVELSHARKLIAQGLMRYVDFAKDRNIKLVIEPFGLRPKLACSAEHIVEICQTTWDHDKKVWACLDTGNLFFAGQHVMEVFDKLWPYILHVHMKNWRTVPEGTSGSLKSLKGLRVVGCSLEDGIIPNELVAAELRKREYHLGIHLEPPICGVDPLEHPSNILNRDVPLMMSFFNGGSSTSSK